MLIGKEGKGRLTAAITCTSLKFDGERCLAYLDSNKGTTCQQAGEERCCRKYTSSLHSTGRPAKKCILDGELVVAESGISGFEQMKQRWLTSTKAKIEVLSKKVPVTFIAFDILYLQNDMLMDRELLERKILLEKALVENERLSVSKYIEKRGTRIFELASPERAGRGLSAKNGQQSIIPAGERRTGSNKKTYRMMILSYAAT